MEYSLLVRLAKWEVILSVGGIAGIIVTRLLTGRINTRYLLWGTRSDGTKYFSPERVQLLLATLAVATQYMLSAVHSSRGQMPTVPAGALELLGLSNGVYLGGKGWMMLGKQTFGDNKT